MIAENHNVRYLNFLLKIDFCLRFDDEFNVGSDDWKPDKKRSTIDVKGKRYVVILNACVVPSGTFNVCWRDLGK